MMMYLTPTHNKSSSANTLLGLRHCAQSFYFWKLHGINFHPTICYSEAIFLILKIFFNLFCLSWRCSKLVSVRRIAFLTIGLGRAQSFSPIQWKRISHKQSTRWQHLSWLKASAFFSLSKEIVVKKCNNLYFGLVTPSSGWWSPIYWSWHKGFEWIKKTQHLSNYEKSALLIFSCSRSPKMLQLDI